MNFEMLAHVTLVLSEVVSNTDSRRALQTALRLRDYIANPVPLTIRSAIRPIADVFGDIL